MRMMTTVTGCLLLAFGVWVLVGKATYPSTETLVKVGSAELTQHVDKAVPQWAGIAGLVVGGVLVLAGVRRRRR